MESSIHEFWMRDDGQPMLDDRPLLGVQSYAIWSEADLDAHLAHIKFELICDVVGQHRRTRSLEKAYKEAMEALDSTEHNSGE